MSRRYDTVPAALSVNIRAPRATKPPPLTATQRAERQEATRERTEQLNGRLSTFWNNAQTFCTDLSEEFGFSPRHAMDLIFCEGTRLLHARSTTNPYNAFMSLKFEEIRNSKLGFAFIAFY
jgi:hypothetical protein